MRKIGKSSVSLFSTLFAALILMPMVNPVCAGIEQRIWEPPYVFRGYDYNYYQTDIVAYLNGTTVKIKIPVYGTYSPYMNVSVVSMVFDWGLNKTLDYVDEPIKIDYGETRYFTISFTADLDEASNAWAHRYIISVEIVYPYSTTWNAYPGYKFVVFSQDQKDVIDLYNKYEAYRNGMPPYYFETTKAGLLATQATAEASQAQILWKCGNFTETKTHYQTAVNLYEQAFAFEEDKGVAMEDAELDAMTKEANATVKQADAAMLQAQASMNQVYGYVLGGLGVILIGIGTIVYGAKKPKTVQS